MISYHVNNKLFSLDTRNTTYQLRIDEYGVLQHIYYGGKLYGSAEYMSRHVCRGMGASIADTGSDRSYELDTIMREYPTPGVGDFRSSGLILQSSDGTECTDLRYVSHSIRDGKYALQELPAVFATEREAQTLSIILEDAVTHIQVELLYGVLPELDVITRAVRIYNNDENAVTLKKVSSGCLDLPYGDYDLLSFHGTHAMERQLQRTEITNGCYSIGSRRGVSSHQYNPAVIIAEKSATETAGGCYGMVFVYSGGFLLEAEKTQFDQTRIIMGIQPEFFHYPLKPGECFTVPETILTYSEKGFEALSHNFHKLMLNHLCRGEYVYKARPILVNSWESAYMDFNGDTIVELAKEAASVGLDMVVMDDGWFGHRNDDNTSLGDWFVNEEKLGCTLGQMIEQINAEGVKFGIWIEPEMISEDSDLYRQHPDWALCCPGRGAVRSRNQLVLDFSRADIRNHIFTQICQVIDQGNVEYIKWDMNRSIADIWSAQRPAGAVLHDYILGVYDFAEKLITRYPHILLESCSSGGGRFDAGMLYYSPQIWCSDNTDALDRIKIQYGTSFFYPISSMGAHVSVCPNHQTGRTAELNTRGVVAMCGTFGYELNLGLMSDEEKAEVREQIKTFKQYRDLIRDGKFYRLTNPFESNLSAWQFVSENGAEALLSAVIQQPHGCKELYYVKLRGLQENGIYEDTTRNRYSGSALMKAGYPVSELWGQAPACQIYLQRREGEIEE